MDSREPALKPEWLFRTAGSSAGSNGRPGTSLHSDEHGGGINSSRSRQSGSGCGSDLVRSLNSSRRNTAFSVNGSRKPDKDGLGKSRGYGSFGRNNRERMREKESPDFRGRDFRSLALEDDVVLDSLDPFCVENRLRRAQSMLSRPPDMKDSRPSSSNGLRKSVTGFTFEREFPVLGAEERDVKFEVERAPSPSLNSQIKSVSPARVPNGIADQVHLPDGANNGLVSLSLSKTVSTSHGLEETNASASLNMAKTLAQTPSRAYITQMSVDSQLIEERNRKQCQNLIPLTPLVSKNSVSSSSDKLRIKGTNAVAPLKSAQQLSLPSATYFGRPVVRNDRVMSTQQGGLQDLKQNGGFQDLKLNGISLTAKDVSNNSKPASPSTQDSSVGTHPLKCAANQKLKGDNKGLLLFSPQGTFGERKSRQDFFNTLRNKPSNGSSDALESVCLSSPPVLADPEHIPEVVAHETSNNMSEFDMKPLENGNVILEGFGYSEHSNHVSFSDKEEEGMFCEHELDSCDIFSPPIDDPEEEKFLLSLGWNGNEKVDALTPEEIESFKSQHPDVVSRKSGR